MVSLIRSGYEEWCLLITSARVVGEWLTGLMWSLRGLFFRVAWFFVHGSDFLYMKIPFLGIVHVKVVMVNCAGHSSCIHERHHVSDLWWEQIRHGNLIIWKHTTIHWLNNGQPWLYICLSTSFTGTVSSSRCQSAIHQGINRMIRDYVWIVHLRTCLVSFAY